MSDIEIVHPVPADEAVPLMRTITTTFLGEAQGDQFDAHSSARAKDWATFRSWGARAHGRWVASLLTEPRLMRIPDGTDGTHDVTVDALTGVTVNATHRRRGLLTRMLSQSLDEAKERGDLMSILIAAEWPIYGRFGYAPATRYSKYVYRPRLRGAGIEPLGGGIVRQVDADETTRDIAVDIYARFRTQRAGQIDRGHGWWSRQFGVDGYRPLHYGKAPSYYVHEGPNGPDGIVWWAASRDFDLTGDLGAIKVNGPFAADDVAYRNLWAYLAGIDVVDELEFDARPVDEPARWLLSDGRALRQAYTGDHTWLRLLDVPGALAARGYAREDRVVIEVVDDDIGRYGHGRFVLDSGTGECHATTESADVELTQRALASIYLGGFSLREQRVAGNASEVSAGAIARLDSMFATSLPPWNATGF